MGTVILANPSIGIFVVLPLDMGLPYTADPLLCADDEPKAIVF